MQLRSGSIYSSQQRAQDSCKALTPRAHADDVSPCQSQSNLTESTLASIVDKDCIHEWTRLSPNKTLSQLHCKWWGTSMADEEIEWRRQQQSDLTEVDNDENNDDIEGDIGPGCYVLSHGVENLAWQSLWVRQDYIRIYDYCNKCSNQFGGRPMTSVVITGQPGIGKTYWNFYALRRRISEKKPIIWYRQKRFYLFVQEGVFVAPSTYETDDFRTIVWTLVDSSEHNSPGDLTTMSTRLFVTFTSSPSPKQWAKFHQGTIPTIVYMNPWTRKEIMQAAPLHFGPQEIDKERINNLYDCFGPTPYICFNFIKVGDVLRQHEQRYRSALYALSAKRLQQMIVDAADMELDGVAHIFFLVERQNRDDLVMRSLRPITTAIKTDIGIQLRNETRDAQIALYEYFASSPRLRSTAGAVYPPQGNHLLQHHDREDEWHHLWEAILQRLL